MKQWYKLDGERMLFNAKKTAEFFNITERSLIDWAKRGCPKEMRGWYDIKAVMVWRGLANSGENVMSDEARKLKFDADYREIKADRERKLLAIMDGQYIAIEDVTTEWVNRVVEVKSGLLSLAKKISSEFTDPPIKRTIEKVVASEVYSLLDQYSREGVYTPKNKKVNSVERLLEE